MPELRAIGTRPSFSARRARLRHERGSRSGGLQSRQHDIWRNLLLYGLQPPSGDQLPRSIVFEEQVRACSFGGLFRFRRVVECAMIYTLTVILVLVGAAASAVVVIAMWDAGVPVWRRWRQRQRAS